MTEKIRVAIFEDEAHYRNSIISCIDRSVDFLVAGAFPNGQKLIQRIDECKPDLILMDISMPDISGIDAVKSVVRHFPNIPVLMQTVFDDDDKVFASICSGASGYILKSEGPAALLEGMRQVWRGGSALSPSIARKILLMVKSQRPHTDTEVFDLTSRETEILQYMVNGLSYKEIANEMSISSETVHSHIKKIYEKLHVHSMSGAVAKAIRHKIVN